MSAREFPYPPRMMTRARAAHYCDLSEAEFQREVDCGMLPAPLMLGKKQHWSRKEMDTYLDKLEGGTAVDWRQGSNLYGKRRVA